MQSRAAEKIIPAPGIYPHILTSTHLCIYAWQTCLIAPPLAPKSEFPRNWLVAGRWWLVGGAMQCNAMPHSDNTMKNWNFPGKRDAVGAGRGRGAGERMTLWEIYINSRKEKHIYMPAPAPGIDTTTHPHIHSRLAPFPRNCPGVAPEVAGCLVSGAMQCNAG